MKIASSFIVLALGAISLNAAPITVKSVKKDAAGMTMEMQSGVLQLQVSGDRTIHVLYSPVGDLPKVPSGFAVQKQPDPGAFDVVETVDAVTLKATQCSAVVDKKSGEIAFMDTDGKPFLKETADGGKSLTPSTVAGESRAWSG